MGFGPLVTVESWRVVGADEDPFSDRPEAFRCSTGGHGPEGDVYEVETDKCQYVTAVQPSLDAVGAGQRVSSLMWHQTLDAESDAEAHVAFRIGPHLVWEERIPIPFPPESYVFDWVAPEDVPRGTPVYLHVHNHGANSYRFGSTEIVDPSADR